MDIEIIEDNTDNGRLIVPKFILPLTRREQFAMAAMQGMIACGASKYRDNVHGIVSSVVSGSVNYADELIKELEQGE